MGGFRRPADLEWAAPETDAEREERLSRLCRLDGVLYYIEEHQLRSGPAAPVPRPVWVRAILAGVYARYPIQLAELMDLVFEEQARWMRPMIAVAS